jgi:hypothetical protein
MTGKTEIFSVLKYENNQQVATIKVNLLFIALHVSGNVFAHHQKHLTVFTVSGSTTRYCKYNQVLLMMGENIARNM